MSTAAGAPPRPATRLALPLAAVFTVAAGYGVVMPVLPFILARLPDEMGQDAIAWHTGGLTGVYMLALLLFAPVWGFVSDRTGRRAAMLIGLAAFSVAILLFGFARDMTIIYGSRALAGISAAAVLPLVLARVGDLDTPELRARGFAWLSAASALGFLFGPALSGWLAAVDLVAPFFAVAIMGGMVWLAVCAGFDDRSGAGSGSAKGPHGVAPPLPGLIVLSLLTMFGLGSFEVALTLQGQQALNLPPTKVSLMFVECSLVMILVQAFVFLPLIKRFGGLLLAWAFLVMAAGSALLPYSTNYYLLLLGVAMIAGASGILIPALAYLVSFAAGVRQGAALGVQTAAASLGQAAGSFAAGWLFGLFAAAPFWAAAAVLGFGVVVALRTTGASRENLLKGPVDSTSHRAEM